MQSLYEINGGSGTPKNIFPQVYDFQDSDLRLPSTLLYKGFGKKNTPDNEYYQEINHPYPPLFEGGLSSPHNNYSLPGYPVVNLDIEPSLTPKEGAENDFGMAIFLGALKAFKKLQDAEKEEAFIPPMSLGGLFSAAQIAPPEPVIPQLPEHTRFDHRRLVDFVRNNVLDLQDILRLEQGRKVPKGLEKYSLAPVMGSLTSGNTLASAGYTVSVPQGVTCHYNGKGEKPYLDSSLALGLVYRGTLAAIAGAGITPDGALRIVQLQGVYNDKKNPIDPNKTGLRGGFLWRDTLVQGWARIASEVGIPQIEILGARNNSWRNATRMPGLIRGYDQVAQRMGFTENTKGNWQASVEQLMASSPSVSSNDKQ